MSPNLAPDVGVGWAASLEDETTLLAAQLEHHGVNQTPTVIGKNLRIGHPAPKQVVLLGPQFAQSLVHGWSLMASH